MFLRFLARSLKARFRNDRQEIHALMSHIRPGEIAVDVGSNKGSHLLWLSRSVGPGKVVAFEPQPHFASYLSRMVKRCGLANVVIEPKAVSDQEGESALYFGRSDALPGATLLPSRRSASRPNEVRVPTVTLDGYFASRAARVAAIKIDVEGHEPAVFRGAHRLLQSDAPLLVFECEERHLLPGKVEDCLAWLREAGYDGWFVHRHRLIPINEFCAPLHQPRIGPRFFAQPDYCNNFIMRRAA